ncbi:MAG: pyruvate kinase [Patescibacteria group bacterium]
MKKTKIVATIGPATETEEVLSQMIAAGMNVARFNAKHSTPKWHAERIERVKKLAKKTKITIGVLLDLQGPEIRIDLPSEKSFKMKRGDLITFTSDRESKPKRNTAFIPQLVIDSIPEKNEILLDDGACEFTIVEKGSDYFKAESMSDCEVSHRKTMNTPGIVLDMPSLTPRDYQFLDGVDAKFIDFVGLSFVRDKSDIKILRNELDKRKMEKASIIAKIENQAALDNIDEIIETADGIMIARGDLGIEVHYKKTTFWQKQIIKKCRTASKPVITATQMLKSMVSHSRATRAEVSDVTNAIFDGTDALMLSEETTIGEFPVQAVTVQATIAEYNEEYAQVSICQEMEKDSDFTASITRSAIELLNHATLNIDQIVCLTTTGKTARLLSRFRPNQIISAVSTIEKTSDQLSLSYGIESHYVDDLNEKKQKNMRELVNILKKKQIVQKGETILLLHGKYLIVDGMSNTLSIVEVK